MLLLSLELLIQQPFIFDAVWNRRMKNISTIPAMVLLHPFIHSGNLTHARQNWSKQMEGRLLHDSLYLHSIYICTTHSMAKMTITLLYQLVFIVIFAIEYRVKICILCRYREFWRSWPSICFDQFCLACIKLWNMKNLF